MLKTLIPTQKSKPMPSPQLAAVAQEEGRTKRHQHCLQQNGGSELGFHQINGGSRSCKRSLRHDRNMICPTKHLLDRRDSFVYISIWGY
jgi:hypothetical protein